MKKLKVLFLTIDDVHKRKEPKIAKMKLSSLLLIILAIGTLVSAFFNYQSDKLIMSGLGLLISIACFWLYYKESRKKDHDG